MKVRWSVRDDKSRGRKGQCRDLKINRGPGRILSLFPTVFNAAVNFINNQKMPGLSDLLTSGVLCAR